MKLFVSPRAPNPRRVSGICDEEGLRLMRDIYFTPATEPGELLQLAAIVQPESARAIADMAMLGWRWPRRPRRQPVLVLGGELDMVFPPHQVRRVARRWQAEFEIVPAAGHAMILDRHWQGCAARIVGWLQRIAAAGPAPTAIGGTNRRGRRPNDVRATWRRIIGAPTNSREITNMGLDRVPSGKSLPNDFNVIIEIPMHADPVKYEVDKESGAVFVDRFMSAAMHYPCNYGYIPHTIAGDGDPVDVLVLTQFALPPGVVVRCRPIGLLAMEDEAGPDGKLLAVPVDSLTPMYRDIESPRDLPQIVLDQIAHFFAHYKDLERGKFVRIIGWLGCDEAKREIMDGVRAYDEAKEKPAF